LGIASHFTSLWSYLQIHDVQTPMYLTLKKWWDIIWASHYIQVPSFNPEFISHFRAQITFARWILIASLHLFLFFRGPTPPGPFRAAVTCKWSSCLSNLEDPRIQRTNHQSGTNHVLT
jgi:hypothetical protein